MANEHCNMDSVRTTQRKATGAKRMPRPATYCFVDGGWMLVGAAMLSGGIITPYSVLAGGLDVRDAVVRKPVHVLLVRWLALLSLTLGFVDMNVVSDVFLVVAVPASLAPLAHVHVLLGVQAVVVDALNAVRACIGLEGVSVEAGV